MQHRIGFCAAGPSRLRVNLGLLGATALFLRPLAARAGPVLPDPLSINLNSQGYYNGLWGDRSRSFLTQGWFEQHNLNARFGSTTKDGLEVNGQVSAQATDDPLVTARRGKWQVLGGFFSVEKPRQYRLEGGNIAAQSSRATLTSSVLGLGGYYQLGRPASAARLTAIAGQVQPAVEGKQFERGIYGGSLGQAFVGDLGGLKVQANAFRVEDVTSSIQNSLGLTPLDLTVYSANTDIRSRTGLGLAAELAATRAYSGSSKGTSLWLSPHYSKGLVNLGANLERNSPRFNNPVGSAAADVKRGDANLSIGKTHQVTLSALYAQNNVEGQLAATSKTRSLGASARTVPFEKSEAWKALSVTGDYRLTRTDGLSRGQSAQYGVGLGLRAAVVTGSLRGEFNPSRDYADPSNDRNTYRASWQMALTLANAKGWRFRPEWTVSGERGRSLSSHLTNRSETVSAGITAAYADRLTVGARHDLLLRLSQPGERRTRNNSTEASLRVKLRTKVPAQLGISYTYKDYRDSSLKRFGESVVRGTLNLKF